MRLLSWSLIGTCEGSSAFLTLTLFLRQELIGLIKNSKIPIICMCNDRNHMKIRSLANYCFDLRFQRPRVEQIKVAEGSHSGQLWTCECADAALV